MASIRRKSKSWEASIYRRGSDGVPRRLSRSFPLKREAVAWASSEEASIASGAVRAANIPLSDLFLRYAKEITPKKRTSRTEALRLGVFSRDFLGSIRLSELTPLHISNWRDRRLEKVSQSSVRREMALLSSVFSVAVKEWGLLAENPCSYVKKPSENLPRDRRISEDEIRRVLLASSYLQGEICACVSARVGAAFVFAIETGMRLGEICGLSWSDISGVVAHLPLTKNGTSRNVPLSSAALSVLRDLPKEEESKSVFGLRMDPASTLFRRIASRALIDDLHFHDTRHEAITRLSSKLNVLDLARMVGIRDLKILLVYYNKKAHEIAEILG